MAKEKFNAIIFDLGGVIINLDVQRTFHKFSSLSQNLLPSFSGHYFDLPFFKQYELGKISCEEFRNDIRQMIGIHTEDQDIDHAWNAMLLDIPQHRIAWLKHLREKYHLILLSNTNAIHIESFNERFQQTAVHHPEDFFDHVVYSHQVQMRKPDADIFQHVLKSCGKEPGEVLFFDDLPENINTARELGIRSTLVEQNNLKEEDLPL